MLPSHQSPPVSPVPDAVLRHYLEAAEQVLTAAWGCADVANPLPSGMPQPPNPKHAAVESIQALDAVLKAAFCGDGADAVIGHSMVAKSLSRKALDMRGQGLMGVHVTRAMFGHPG